LGFGINVRLPDCLTASFDIVLKILLCFFHIFAPEYKKITRNLEFRQYKKPPSPEGFPVIKVFRLLLIYLQKVEKDVISTRGRNLEVCNMLEFYRFLPLVEVSDRLRMTTGLIETFCDAINIEEKLENIEDAAQQTAIEILWNIKQFWDKGK